MKQTNNLTFRQDKFEIIHIIVGKYRHMYFPTANRLVNEKKIKWKKHALNLYQQQLQMINSMR